MAKNGPNYQNWWAKVRQLSMKQNVNIMSIDEATGLYNVKLKMERTGKVHHTKYIDDLWKVYILKLAKKEKKEINKNKAR